MSFSVVKITENIHGIDLFNHEGFDFAKSGTEKKKNFSEFFTANRSFCLSTMIDIQPSINWCCYKIPPTSERLPKQIGFDFYRGD